MVWKETIDIFFPQKKFECVLRETPLFRVGTFLPLVFQGFYCICFVLYMFVLYMFFRVLYCFKNLFDQKQAQDKSYICQSLGCQSMVGNLRDIGSGSLLVL